MRKCLSDNALENHVGICLLEACVMYRQCIHLDTKPNECNIPFEEKHGMQM